MRMILIILTILTLSSCLYKKELVVNGMIPEQRRYRITVLINTEASKTYTCNGLATQTYFAIDCEDNEGRRVDYVYYQGFLTEVYDTQVEVK